MHTDVRLQWVRAWIVFTGFLGLDCVESMEQHRRTACAGTCHNNYSLECPLRQKIAILKLSYYVKTNAQCPARSSCQNSECCVYDELDCLDRFSDIKAFPVYQSCSGRQQCGWLQAESVKARNCGGLPSNYISASFQCVADNSFLDICSNLTLESYSINLIYNGVLGSLMTDSRLRQCACSISTSDCDSPARLHFKTVDVRLHEHNNITKCHQHSKFTITDTMGSRNFYCQSNHFYKQYNDIYFSSSPYARISLYNIPGIFPSQLWLQVKATMAGQKLRVSCGKEATDRSNFCGPPEMLPTTPAPKNPVTITDIFNSKGNRRFNPKDKSKPDLPQDNGSGGGGSTSSKEQSDLPAYVGGAVAAAILIFLIVLVVCLLLRRQANRRRKQKARESSAMLPSATLPPVPLSDPQDPHCGNYYESVGATSENGGPTSVNFNMYSPNKVMETFSPTRKTSDQFFPSDMKAPPPPPTPQAEKKSPENGLESNPYHIPWDNPEFAAANRAKRRDLAYATSDEIQVLIQRMERDRRFLNEGSDEEQVVPDRKLYIHIDDYKINRPPSQHNRHSQVEEGDLDEEEEENDTSDKIHGYRFEDDDDDDDDDDDEEYAGASNSVERPKPKPRTFKIDSHDTLNNCESEDTGYRSVGSPDQVLVSEDDYLIPGSVKSSYSNVGSGRGSLPKCDSGANVEREAISGGYVNDNKEDDSSPDQDVLTKF